MKFTDFRKRLILISLLILSIVSLAILKHHLKEKNHLREKKSIPIVKPKRSGILDNILARGELNIITRNNAHCYYNYRDEPMGFEYELVKAFADHLGVKLKIIIAQRWDTIVSALMQGDADLAAASLAITDNRKKQVAFSKGYMTVEQSIVVHRDNADVQNANHLSGKTVHVRRGTSYQDKLESLVKQGFPIQIALHEDTPTEELIRQIAEKEIEVTIANSNIAHLNRRYYPDIFINSSISEKQEIGWAVNHQATQLLEQINSFMTMIKQNGFFSDSYNRYYTGVDNFDYLDISRFHERIELLLPNYISVIQRISEKNELDWRLIAAQIYQESHFNPKICSRFKACGLMQLTQTIAKKFKVKNVFDPEENIRSGIRYLKELYDFYDKASNNDRIYIALAAYNIGQGHMLDARNLARDMKLDPDKWDSMAHMLPLLSDLSYHKDAIYGYCRGIEPVNYVNQIRIYYDILKWKDIEYPQSLTVQTD